MITFSLSLECCFRLRSKTHDGAEGFFANSSVGVITPKIVSFCGWSGDQIENKSKTCRIESVKEDVSGRGDFGNLPPITFKTPVFS